MSKRTIILVTTILTLTIVVSGIVVVKQAEKNSAERGDKYVEKIEDVDTSDWKTYRHDEYNVSFKLPNNWQVGTGIVAGGFLGDIGIYNNNPIIIDKGNYTGEKEPVFALSFDRYSQKPSSYQIGTDTLLENNDVVTIYEGESSEFGDLNYVYLLKNAEDTIIHSIDVFIEHKYIDKIDVRSVIKAILDTVIFIK